MEAVGSWAPADNEGTIYTLGSCSAHYFDVKGSLIAYAWYGQGTRILDISNPEKPIQVAYFRPDGGNVWASYFRNGYVYTADAARGVDILKLKQRRQGGFRRQEGSQRAEDVRRSRSRTCRTRRPSTGSPTRRPAGSACCRSSSKHLT